MPTEPTPSIPALPRDGHLLLRHHWPEIRRVVERAQRSSLHCALTTVAPDGSPHVTPVGTVFLRDDCTGWYYDAYTQALAHNLDANPQVCLMAVDAGRAFWLRSFLLGRFTSPPGLRLYGEVGPLRPATLQERAAVELRVRPTR